MKSLVIAGYLCLGLSMLILPPLFGLAALIIGLINTAKGEVGHGIAQMVLAFVTSFIGMVLSAIVFDILAG